MTTPSRRRRFDPVAFIMAVEMGDDDMTPQEWAEGMTAMIDSGIIWHLQGSWQREGQAFIASGLYVAPDRRN
jgi:hypothetical protein